MPNKVLKMAHYYIEKGMNVFPIEEGSKRPPVVGYDDEKKKDLRMAWIKWQNDRVTDEQAGKWWKGKPKLNIAMVCGAVSGKFVIDIDNYKDTPKGIAAQFQALLKEEGCTPMVKTPRGGLHYYFKYDTRVVNRAFDDVDIKSDGGYVLIAPSLVDGAGYRWIKDGNFSNVVTDRILEFISNLTNTLSIREGGVGGEEGTKGTKGTDLIPDGSRDHALFHIANVLAKRGVPVQEIEYIVGLIGRHACAEGDDPVTQEQIDVKVHSALKRAGREQKGIAPAVREWVMEQVGNFMAQECYKDLDLSTKGNKKAARQEFMRLVKKGTIERYGEKSSSYRTPDSKAEILDLNEVVVKDTGLVLPFGISQELIYIMPKSVILIAGSPNVGKTAFMLNVFKDNLKMNPIYFSSEMGAMEIKARVDLFQDWPSQANARFRSRSMNFHDVIEPDGLNIIDFLELEDNFYQVTGKLRMIQDKLNDGIAVVAIQKKKGASEAIGGHFSMEKPKLVLTLDVEEEMGVMHNVAKIIKCKNWRDVRHNPTGLSLRFRLRRGCEFDVVTGWDGVPAEIKDEEKDDGLPF